MLAYNVDSESSLFHLPHELEHALHSTCVDIVSELGRLGALQFGIGSLALSICLGSLACARRSSISCSIRAMSNFGLLSLARP
jgi:hypothetical protein